MTISSTNRKAGPFIGNGSAIAFAFPFKVFKSADVSVVMTDTATGWSTVLVLNSDYSVTLNPNQESSPGGSITLVAGPLATGKTLIVTSDMPNLQLTAITNQGGFYPDVINDALDRATILIQQLQVAVDSALKQLAVQPCVGSGAVFTAPGTVAAVFVNGVLQAPGAYTAAGAVITLNFTTESGDTVNALCTSF